MIIVKNKDNSPTGACSDVKSCLDISSGQQVFDLLKYEIKQILWISKTSSSKGATCAAFKTGIKRSCPAVYFWGLSQDVWGVNFSSMLENDCSVFFWQIISSYRLSRVRKRHKHCVKEKLVYWRPPLDFTIITLLWAIRKSAGCREKRGCITAEDCSFMVEKKNISWIMKEDRDKSSIFLKQRQQAERQKAVSNM